MKIITTRTFDLLFGQLNTKIQRKASWKTSLFKENPFHPATKLKAMPIVLPSITEQRRILTYLDNLEAKVQSLKKCQTQTSTELNALLPSILDKAFKGEL